MSKITKSQKAQGLIVALTNLAIEAGYNLNNAELKLEDMLDPENTEPTVPFNQLVNECLDYLASLDEQQTTTTENENHELIKSKKRYI